MFSVSNNISLNLTVIFPLSFFVGFFIFPGKGHAGTIANASKYSKNGTTYNSTYLSSSSSTLVRGSTKGSPGWLTSRGISISWYDCLSNSTNISYVVGR